MTVVREHQPDLVLLDIALPVMDGLQALALIRHESPGSTVVMLSGFSESVAALAAVENGAHGYVRGCLGPGAAQPDPGSARGPAATNVRRAKAQRGGPDGGRYSS